MLTEPLPIEIFVATRFEERRISKLIELWPVESSVLIKIVIAHFKEMGLYSVNGDLEKQIYETILVFLKSSPAIAEVLYKAQMAEAARRQSRHSQGA